MNTILPRLAVAMCAFGLFPIPSWGGDTHQSAAGSADMELVFIDGSVAGASELQAGIRGGVETFLVDAKGDLIAEVTAKLRQRAGIKAVRVISHAAPGVLKLGVTAVDGAALEQRAGLIRDWRQGMTQDGLVAFYGCDLASHEVGREWIERFAAISGLGVAASVNKTGSASLGGDWHLEVQAGGAVAADAPLFRSGFDYQGLLPVPLTGVDPNFNTVYVRPGGNSNTWVFGPFNSSGHSGSGIPDGPNTIKEVTYFDSGGSILNRGKFQYSTNGGSSWVDLTYGAFPGLAVSGKTYRFVDLTPGDTVNNDSCFTAWTYLSIPAASTSTGQNIIVDNEPTDVFPTTTDYWVTANGEQVTEISVTDTGNPNGGVYVLENQGVANLFTLSGSNLFLGAGALPSVGVGATVSLRYYDYYQTDNTGAPVAGQGVARTVTMVRRSNPAGFSNDAKANTFTANGQANSQIAGLSDGSYVVVWRSAGQNGESTSTGGIYGQKFTAAGVASGSEFAISPANNGKNETAPAVAGLSGGRFVVAYTQPNTDNDIIFRIVEANGTLGAETSVTATTGAQSAASVTTLTDGNFAIAFIGPNGADTADVWVRKFNGSTGAAISSSELVVNTTQTGNQSVPWVSGLSDGNYVVAWRDPADSGNIYCRVMGATAAVSTEITVANGVAAQNNPRCTGLTGGGFVVVCNEAGRTEGSIEDTTSQSNVYARRYNNAGTLQGGEFLVNGGTRGNQLSSGISRLTNGGFVIGFSSNTDPDGSNGIFGRRFDASGNAVDSHEFQMNQRRIDTQTAVNLAALENSGFATSWTDTTLDGASDTGVGTRAFSGVAPAAPEIAVTETGVGTVADGGSFSFGSTTEGTPVTKTFTVTNSGTATLNLSGLSVPSGFSIAQNFGSTTVAAGGGTTTFQITMTAAAAATPSGTLSFTNDDTDENPYDFTISGTVTAAPPPDVSLLGTPTYVTAADSIASFTVPTGNKRLLLVTVSHADTTEVTAASAVTFNGLSLTQVGVKKDGASVDTIWARVLGDGSAITGPISATRYPSTGTTVIAFISAQAFQNVDQATPTSGTTTFSHPTAGNASIDVPSAVGDMVMDLYDVWKLSGSPIPSANGSPTQLNNSGALPLGANLASYGGTANYITSIKPGAAGTVNMSWTTTADAVIQVGLNIRRASGGGGGAPEIAVTETGVGAVADGGSFSFGTTTEGTPVTKTFTVTNSGTATLNLSGLSVPSGFSIAQNFGSATVAASGGTTTFQITMTAAAAATPSGTLSFTNDDADENPYDFTISGTVNPPPPAEIAVSYNGQNVADGASTPAVLNGTDFGSAPVQGVTVDHIFTISNSGGVALTLGAVSATGDFSITEQPSSPVVGGSTTTFTVRFNPSAVGARTGTVSFTNSDGDETPFDFSVSGTGTGPQTFDQATNAASNTPYDSGETYIYSPGGGPVAPTITSPTSTAVTHNSATLGGNVTADGGAAITARGVVYAKTTDDATPAIGEPNVTNTTATGTTGVFTIDASGLTGSTQYTFAAYATNSVGTTYTSPFSTFTTPAAPNPEIVVEQPADTELTSPGAAVSFGKVELASTVERIFTVKNTGTSLLTLGAITFTGANAGDFTASAPGSSTLPATTGSTTFTVTFTPLAAGSRNAVMHIASDDADENPFDVSLTGSGESIIGGTMDGTTPVVTTTGVFDCTDVTFDTDLGFVPVPGQTYPYIHADGGVVGTFNDLPDGGVVALAINGVIYYFQVEYTGTDVTLTNFTPSAPPAWKWVGGPKARNGIGVYGTLGTASADNNPGARQGGMNWRSPDGSLWLFGGYGQWSVASATPRYLNDVWQYRRDLGQWVWRAGSNVANQVGVYGTAGVEAAGNAPGSRHSGTTFTDGDGNLWLFGGFGVGSTAAGAFPLNDLWRFNRSTGQWTWMKGSTVVNGAATYGTQGTPAAANTPGARSNAAGFYREGSLWLFGGYSGANHFGDLWRYDIASGNWTWVGGSSTPNQNGVYGTQGTAAAGNRPGSRRDATGWVALDGTLWLFGGLGLPASGTTLGDLSDLWTYNPVSGEWTWVKGADTTNSTGVYGTIDTPAPTNLPGARSAGSGWVTVDGDLWLVAGFKNAGQSFDDVWIYDVASNQWTWKLGSAGLLNQVGAYGTQGVADPANKPGGRFTPSTWVTLNGSLWIFGGGGMDGMGGTGRLSDLWSYAIPNPPGAPFDNSIPSAFPDSLIINTAPSASDTTAGTMAYVPVSGQLSGKDVDGDPILFGSAGSTNSSQGTLTLNADGTWTYTPAYGFTGVASFQFKANDLYGGVSPVKTLIISVVPNPADSDGDGIADAYEQGVWGNIASADGDGDADLDGQSNYFEFLAGTNPLDGGDRLRTAPSVSGVGTANGGVQLQLNYVRPGVNYHLETSSDLEIWSRIGTFTFSTAGSATIEDPAPSAGQPVFYRMSLEPTSAVILP